MYIELMHETSKEKVLVNVSKIRSVSTVKYEGEGEETKEVTQICFGEDTESMHTFNVVESYEMVKSMLLRLHYL